MIRAIIFDLDGTLVQTEQLKALSYARAAKELCPECATEDEIMEGFKDVVGRPRQEVAQSLVERFGLERAARGRMAKLGVNTPWQAFVQIRLDIYEHMLSNPEIVRKSQLPHAIALLHEVRRRDFKTALTTTSHAKEACQVLNVLGITNQFDFIATADDVERTKPNPEVYLLVTSELGISPSECLAIEDSPPGVQAALAAGVGCIAVTNEFTRESIHAAHLLDEKWIVDDAGHLADVVDRMIEERMQDSA